MKKKLFLILLLILFITNQNSHTQWSPGTSLVIENDFKVNDDGSNHFQANPNVAVGGNGNFIVVWDDNRNGYTDIFCQAYSNVGNPLGGNLKVNEPHNAHHQFPDIASDSLGNFIIAWADARDGTFQIYGQYYQSNGAAIGNNFGISSDAGQTSTGNASVAMNNKGDFVAFWQNTYQGASQIYGQRYSNTRVQDGGNFQVNDNTVSNHIFPDVAIDNNGNIVVVWEEERAGQYDIYAQRFDNNGNPLWGNFKVNDETNSTHQMHPAIGIDAEGNFVIAWNDWRDGAINIYCQRFDGNGVKINSNFRVNDDAGANGITYPDVAMAENGSFIVTWPHNITGIYGQLFNSSGIKSGTNFRIDNGNDNTRQLLPCVAISDNRLFSSWQDNRLESQWDIFANILDLTTQMPEAVETPIFDPLPGTYTSSVTVSFQCATEGVVIHYTTDGSEPSETSAVYTSPVSIPVTTTLKAMAYKDGLIPSAVNTGVYTIEQEPSITDDGLTIVHLHQGWNLFSFDVQPTDLRVSEILSSINGDFDWIVGFENGIEVTYHPDSSATSTLQTFNPLHGYYIHMFKPAVLSISGIEISSNTPIPLSEGVHLISYLPDDNLVVSEALQSILDHVVYVKAIDMLGVSNGQGTNGGLSYDPALPEYSTLFTMQNGFGYWIQVDANVTLTYPEESVGTVLASTTIGPEGGTLSTDEFILTVPEGAFISDFNLTLYQFTEDLSYNEDANSAIFALEGMPDDFAIPIRLALKYTDDLSDQSFIALGGRTFIPELSNFEYLPFLYEATDSLGYLVTTLPAGESGQPEFQTGPQSALLKRNIKLKTGLKIFNALKGRQTHRSKYFTIAYPFFSDYASTIPDIGTYFDDVVQTAIGGTGMGFSSTELDLLRKRLFHIIVEDDSSPIDYFLKTKSYQPPLFVNIVRNFNRCELHINEKTFVEDHDLLKQKAGILVFGLRQWMKFNDQQYWSWLNYAYQLWVGEKFSILPSFYDPYSLSPFKEQLLISRPFFGLEAGGVVPEVLNVDPEMEILFKKAHGHGMVSFIKYIETETNVSEVRKLWESLKTKTPMEAILNTFQSPENEWWPDYSAKYVQGDFYNITDKSMLNTIPKNNIFTIAKPTDTMKDYDQSYPDFSSALFRVDLQYEKIDSLIFTLGPSGLNLDYETIFVFMIRNGLFEYYGEGVQFEEYIQLIVKKIPTLMESGCTSLIALVVNSANEKPYTGSVDIELEISSRQKVLRDSWITFGNFTYDGTLVDPFSTSTNSGSIDYIMYGVLTGELKDNVYETSWYNESDSWSTYGSNGYMRIEFNFNNQLITLLHFEVISHNPLSTKELTLEAVDIPYRGEDQYYPGWDIYKIVGEAIKMDNITNLTYVQKDHMSAGDWVTTLTDLYTQSNSYIQVYLK